MQVTIKGETVQLYIQTITLQPEEGGSLYGFHCLNCGNFHQKIGGKVSKIYPIYEPSDQVIVVSKCRNCGSEYNFQTHDGYSSDKVKVILHPVKNRAASYFYCYRGKDLLLEYTDSSIYSWTENKKKTTPFSLDCSNASCPMSYLIADML